MTRTEIGRIVVGAAYREHGMSRVDDGNGGQVYLDCDHNDVVVDSLATDVRTKQTVVVLEYISGRAKGRKIVSSLVWFCQRFRPVPKEEVEPVPEVEPIPEEVWGYVSGSKEL
jgi:hypothetical protein